LKKTVSVLDLRSFRGNIRNISVRDSSSLALPNGGKNQMATKKKATKKKAAKKKATKKKAKK
jgi:hypothetical protein